MNTQQEKSFEQNSLKILNIIAMVLAIGLLLFTIYFAYEEMIGRFGYELEETYTADHCLYFAVGKGMVHGLTPYEDLYENKPPMIFLISAISYYFTKCYYLVNIFSFISMVVLLVIPVLYLFISSISKGRSLASGMLLFACLLGPLLLFVFYSEKRSGEAQVEIFGAACSTLSMFFFFLAKDKTKIPFYHPYLIFGGIFFAFALLFKEPFGLLTFVIMLLMIQSKRDILFKFFIPLVYAFIVFCIVLLSCGCFISYFTIYLKNMLSNHISIYGSPIDRMLQVDKLFTDLSSFSVCLTLLLMVFVILDVALMAKGFSKNDAKKNAYVIKDIFVFFLAFLTASFSVGLGGQYYNHHFVFAVPYYLFVLFLFVDLFPNTRYHNVKNRKLVKGLDHQYDSPLMLLFTALLALFIALPSCYSLSQNDTTYSYPDTILMTSQMKEDAAYVDDVCDALNEDTYLYIGFNGFRFFAYTEHDPSGPVFAQDSNNFQDEDNFFVQSFLKQLEEADIIVFNSYNLGVITESTNQYISLNFTAREPEAVQGIEKTERIMTSRPVSYYQYVLYYRTDVFFA